MRLNPDCIRDILLHCEETCAPFVGVRFDCKTSTSMLINGRIYESEETLYHLMQCDLNRYFTEMRRESPYVCVVMDLEPKAHEFLANIREDSNWNKTKEIAKSVGSNSLIALKDIAVKVVAAAIASQLK